MKTSIFVKLKRNSEGVGLDLIARGKEWNLLPADFKRMWTSTGFTNSVLKCYFISNCLCVYMYVHYLYFNVLINSIFCMLSTHNCYPLLHSIIIAVATIVIISCNYLCMH